MLLSFVYFQIFKHVGWPRAFRTTLEIGHKFVQHANMVLIVTNSTIRLTAIESIFDQIREIYI